MIYPQTLLAIVHDHHLDKSPGELAEIIGFTLADTKQLLASDAFAEYVRALPPDSATPTTYSAQELVDWTHTMVDPAMRALEAIVNDPNVSPTQRLAAAQQIFSWQTELQSRKAEAQQQTVYHIHLDPQIANRLDELLTILQSPDLLNAANAAMPHSTA